MRDVRGVRVWKVAITIAVCAVSRVDGAGELVEAVFGGMCG